jgi:2-C-methyl-D-erythritol 2,4-cyclodiphosphate synthase
MGRADSRHAAHDSHRLGYDIHRLYPGHPTVLGGVPFPDLPHGFDTHSDGDVVAHAIIDALAGPLAIGSLGDYFPEDDPADQDARSIEFLARFRPVLDREGAEVINLDCTIFCAAPRIGPAAQLMCSNIADGLGCDQHRINVKGKTNEGSDPKAKARPSRPQFWCSSEPANEPREETPSRDGTSSSTSRPGGAKSRRSST